MNPAFHIGTAGWSYKDWVGVFYPPKLKAGDYLSFYAEYFNCIEVNSSYYTRLAPNIVQSWLKKIEHVDDFSFILKLHQTLTHKRNLDKDELNSFKNNMAALHNANRLLGTLVQFPYSFDCNNANLEYLRKLLDELQPYQSFVELRHKSWSNSQVQDEFNQKGICTCCIDQPIIGEAMEFNLQFTGDKLYIRMHGRNAAAWSESIANFGKKQTYDEQNARYKYLYSRGELLEVVVRIQDTVANVKEVIIIMNNHPQGDAVINAFEIIEFLKLKSTSDLPETTKKRMVDLHRMDVG
jgi:uncharacterized protein YecE (DUF72 family)